MPLFFELSASVPTSSDIGVAESEAFEVRALAESEEEEMVEAKTEEYVVSNVASATVPLAILTRNRRTEYMAVAEEDK